MTNVDNPTCAVPPLIVPGCLLLLVLIGCRPEADSPSPPPSSLLVLDVAVWNEGAVIQLPVAAAAKASNHLGAVPPLAFAIEAGRHPVVAVVQTMIEGREAGWAWHVVLHRYDTRRTRGLIDTLVVGLSGEVSEVSFGASPGSPLVQVGAPAAAGPVIVVRQRQERWQAFGGPDAFQESGASATFEAQVRKRLIRAEPPPPPHVQHAAASPVRAERGGRASASELSWAPTPRRCDEKPCRSG